MSDEPCGMRAGNTVAAKAHRVVMHAPGLAHRAALTFGSAQREVRERAQGLMGLP